MKCAPDADDIELKEKREKLVNNWTDGTERNKLSPISGRRHPSTPSAFAMNIETSKPNWSRNKKKQKSKKKKREEEEEGGG